MGGREVACLLLDIKAEKPLLFLPPPPSALDVDLIEFNDNI
jgi:hypothetical protein